MEAEGLLQLVVKGLARGVVVTTGGMEGEVSKEVEARGAVEVEVTGVVEVEEVVDIEEEVVQYDRRRAMELLGNERVYNKY